MAKVVEHGPMRWQSVDSEIELRLKQLGLSKTKLGHTGGIDHLWCIDNRLCPLT